MVEEHCYVHSINICKGVAVQVGTQNNRNYFFKMVYYVSYNYNSSLLQSTLPLTQYICTIVFHTAESTSELFCADVVQDLQCFLFHFADISKTFLFHLAFHRREQEKVTWCKVG